jgi:hypothetical protein
MGRENHVFSVAPRTAVVGEIDWRLPVFESGRYFVAFDGTALLLRELLAAAKERDRVAAKGTDS